MVIDLLIQGIQGIYEAINLALEERPIIIMLMCCKTDFIRDSTFLKVCTKI